MKILFRPHRSTLFDSLSELKEFNTIEDLLSWVSSYCNFVFDEDISFSDINISYYCFDNRIQWDTYLVSIYRRATRYRTSFPFGFLTFKYL